MSEQLLEQEVFLGSFHPSPREPPAVRVRLTIHNNASEGWFVNGEITDHEGVMAGFGQVLTKCGSEAEAKESALYGLIDLLSQELANAKRTIAEMRAK